VLENKDRGKEDELQPLSKEEALASIKQFKKDLRLTKVRTNKTRIRRILKRSGLISDEIVEMRHEQT
jgi:hypothetical protein